MQRSPFKRSALASATVAALSLFLSVSANAQEAAQQSEQGEEESQQEEEVTELETIQVTGSRIARSQAEVAAPITVITRAQMDREGYTTVADALSSISAATGSVQNELLQSGFTPNATVINLRGLGPGRLLTLINGRRVADYPRPYNSESNFVNIGSIPAVAVERIEYLSGGASAIYGSDAVAGVVNVILVSDYEGDRMTFQAGAPTRGGAETWDFQFLGGKSGDNWSVSYALQSYRRGAIYASERDFMDSYRDEPNNPSPTSVEGLRLRNRSLAPVQGFSRRVLPAGFNINDVCGAFGSNYEVYDAGLAFGNTLPAGASCAMWGFPATQAIRNSDENYSGYFSGSLTLDNGVELYSTAAYYNATAAAASSSEFITTGGMLASVVPNSAILVARNLGNQLFDFQRIFTPEEVGANRGTKYNERTYDATIGAMGQLTDNFDWDATISSSRYVSNTKLPRLSRRETIDFFLGPLIGLSAQGRGIYDLNVNRLLRPLTPAEFASISTITESKASSRSTQGSFVVTGDLWEMGGGNIGFAAVLEAATQSYDLNPDPRTVPGNTEVINLFDSVGGGSRDRYALGAEFRFPFTTSFSANLATRYDQYDDITEVNGAATYNLGLEWRPTENLLVRGTYATSFRAPDMHWIYAGEAGFFTQYFDEFRCRSDGFTVEECSGNADYTTSAAGRSSGNPGLEEEEGKSFTAGFVWDINEDLAFTLDYYKIELEGAVDDDGPSVLNIEANCRLGVDRRGNAVNPASALCADALARVTRDENGDIDEVFTQPKNNAFLGTDGIDATLSFERETDTAGEFGVELAYTHVLGQQRQEFADDPVEEYRDNLQNFSFRSRTRGTFTWDYKDVGLGASFVRIGSLPNWAETGRISPFIYWNLTADYSISEQLDIGLSVNNVFDRIAPEDPTYTDYPFFWRAYSPIGREVFVRVEYEF